MNKWRFSEIPRIEEASFNKVLEKFYDYGIDGLVRENIQNSLDGHIDMEKQPVQVVIKTGVMVREAVPGIDETLEHIKNLRARNKYTEETIEHMKKHMNDEEVHYISFEDRNTKGLTGAKYGQTNNKAHTWSAYAYSKGVHFVEDDDNAEKIRGGSHGIGKIASNAASDLYMMFFANCDVNGEQHIGGTIQLIEHEYQDTCYRSTGYFTDSIDDHFVPFENIETFHPIFQKDVRGLKIIIPFLRKQYQNNDEIVRAVCRNFFMAIQDKKLVVKVNGQLINAETIEDILTNERYFPQEYEKMKKDFTPLYNRTLYEGDKKVLTIKDKKGGSYQFNLFFLYDPAIVRGRTAIIRTIGMKIEDFKVIGHAMKPYNAVMLPATTKEDEFLKSLENEAHTELSYEHIKDIELQNNAKRFINNISREIGAIINEYIRKANPTDGKLNTKDVLYEVQNKFKKDLMRSTTSLRVNEGRGKKTVLKVASTKSKKKDPKKPGYRQGKGSQNVKGKNNYYSIQPNLIHRLNTVNKEMLTINLKNELHLRDYHTCKLHISLMDGMGKEYTDEYKLEQNYNQVIDNNKESPILVKDNALHNVSIEDGIIQIALGLNNTHNKNYKFAYYVEV